MVVPVSDDRRTRELSMVCLWLVSCYLALRHWRPTPARTAPQPAGPQSRTSRPPANTTHPTDIFIQQWKYFYSGTSDTLLQQPCNRYYSKVRTLTKMQSLMCHVKQSFCEKIVAITSRICHLVNWQVLIFQRCSNMTPWWCVGTIVSTINLLSGHIITKQYIQHLHNMPWAQLSCLLTIWSLSNNATKSLF